MVQIDGVDASARGTAACHEALAQGAGRWSCNRVGRDFWCGAMGAAEQPVPPGSTSRTLHHRSSQYRRRLDRSSQGLCRHSPAGPAAWTSAPRRSRAADPQRTNCAVSNDFRGRFRATADRPGNRSGALKPAVRFDQYPRVSGRNAAFGSDRCFSHPAKSGGSADPIVAR